MSHSILTKRQVKGFGPKPIEGYGPGALIKAEVRYDDQCGNGHNTFAITGEIYIPGRRDCEACGCLHEDIAKHFPELAPFIKWHLTSSDGPMYYIQNTLYAAGDRDCWDLRKGEFKPTLDKEGRSIWRINIPHDYQTWGPLHYVHSETRPEPVTLEYVQFGRTGEGKEPQLADARIMAVWPDATDEDLTAPGLKERLEARLPKLLEEFRAAVESLGFTF